MKVRIISALAPALIILLASGCATVEAPTAGQQPQIAQETPSSADAELLVAGSNSEAAYKLSEGDKITIQVFDEPDLSLDASVNAKGSINYSYLGDVRVSGKTPQQLEQHLTSLLKNGYLVNPSVNVSIVEFRPFFIGGEVRSPGSYPFQPGLTLGKAIALAGGLTDRASTRRMFVVRAGTASNQQSKITLNSTVGPGDVVSIKEGFF